MRANFYDLIIVVIAILAVGFILLGVFHPLIAARLGRDDETSGNRLYSVLIGLALLALLWVYHLADDSLAAY